MDEMTYIDNEYPLIRQLFVENLIFEAWMIEGASIK